MRTELENSDVLSEFGSVRAKDVRTLSLEKFVEKVRSNLFRDSVEEYRRLRTLPGHEAEAKRIKDNMPCIVPAGICRGGHAVANLVSHSGLCCIDLDHTGERTGEIRRMAAALPYVCIVFTSISGEGVKLLVRVNVDDVRADYPTLYAAVGRAVSQAVRHPYDDKCKILTQPCFYSWDPDAYYNPDAVPFTLPDAAAPVAVALPDAPPPPSAAAAVALPARATDTGGFLVHFLDDFERRHPFRRGDRHDRCLQLGRVARSKGFSYEELEQLLALLATRYAAGDFSVAEMRQTVMAGYQYVAKVDQGEEKPSRVHLGSGFTLNPKFPASEEDNTEDLLEKNNAVYAETPTFPEWVYGTLPNFLQDCCDRTKDPRERDVLLMGCLVACSVLFPRVSFFYRNQCVSPHFYFALTAPAGTGKGMLGFTTSLLDATQDHYLRKLKEQRKRYEQLLLAWEKEMQDARHAHRVPDANLKPEEPTGVYVKIPSTTSKSRLVRHLADAGDVGCCMTTTEINTLTDAMEVDCGHYEDILCKAAHHEEVSLSYRIDGDPVVARRPRLAISMAGTPEQFIRFFRSLEVGLYSRFACYTCARQLEWKSCAPTASHTDLAAYFSEAGKQLLVMHLGLLESPTNVVFSDEQWEEHTAFFSALLTHTLVEGRQSHAAIIYRSGLLAMRLAAILTVFRKWEDYRYAHDYRCTDEDFHAALALVRVLVEHSLLLSATLPDTLTAPKPVHKFRLLDEILSSLGKKFTYTEFVHLACELGASQSTAKRTLRRAVECQLVEKEEDGYKKSARKTKKVGSK